MAVRKKTTRAHYAKLPGELLAKVPLSRRAFVKRLVGGAFAIPILSSFSLGSAASAAEGPKLPNHGGHYPGWYLHGGYYPGGKDVPPGRERGQRHRTPTTTTHGDDDD